jgi:hypothetical protein
VHGIIDNTHTSISKPQLAFAKDYYHKSESYSIVTNVIVDVKRTFIDLYVGFKMIFELHENLNCINKLNIKGFSVS